MQSSARNCFAARLSEAIHSPKPSLAGLDGARPTLASAPEEREAANARSFLGCMLAAAPREVAHRRPDPAREDETDRESAGDRDRQVRAQLRRQIGRLADLATQLIDRGRE